MQSPCSVEELQKDAEKWIKEYNSERPHSKKYLWENTPMATFEESKHLAQEKMLDEINLTKVAVE